MKIKKINNVDLVKYKSQATVRRRKEVKTPFEKIVIASDADLDSPYGELFN